MKNPYEILFGLLNDGEWQHMQNASRQEIKKVFMKAVKINAKLKRYSQQDLMLAQKQLLSPSKRLLADFIFTPPKHKTKRIIKLDVDSKQLERIDLESINKNIFDNLNEE